MSVSLIFSSLGITYLDILGVFLAKWRIAELIEFADFGIETLVQRASETSCPWLISNVIDNETDKLLANGKGSLVIDWQGIRIGLVIILHFFLSTEYHHNKREGER